MTAQSTTTLISITSQIQSSKSNLSSFYFYKRVVQCDLSKAPTRGNMSPDSKLPVFMEGIHDRNSITMLSGKMLETNHFGEGNF